MGPIERRFWRDHIKAIEPVQDEREKRWNNLRQRLGLSYTLQGVKHPVRISRFYKLVREIVASTAFRHPHVFVKAEHDPADPETGDILKDISPLLEDFANDSLEMVRARDKVTHIISDSLFCFRGWAKFGYLSADEKAIAPYLATDAMQEDFPYIARVHPKNILIDPLVCPEDMYSARFLIERMYPSVDALIDNPRFERFQARLKGLKDRKPGSSVDPLMPEERETTTDDMQKRAVEEAHKLANTVKAYEVHDRIEKKRIVFVDGIDEPIEEIDHPFLTEQVFRRRDPLNGRALLSRTPDITTGTDGTFSKKKFLVEGGLPYYSLAFDVTDEFYGDPPMAYENQIQNAIVRSVTRRLDILERFKRLAKVRRAEADTHPELRDFLRNAEDGDAVELDEMDSLEELEWGSTPNDQVALERDLLAYESQTMRTAADTNPRTATAAAITAAEVELNREFAQAPVEELYGWWTRNLFAVLSQEQFTPENLNLTSDFGEERTELALKAWHLQGRFNINIQAGSSNALFEQIDREKVIAITSALRGSTNINQLELDKMILRSYGANPDQLLKPDANIDAAKAAELEIQMFFAGQDPGVTVGEDHNTHIRLQNPAAIQRHQQFAQLQPEQQELARRIAQQHAAQHQAQMRNETSRLFQTPAPQNAGPQTIQSAVRSGAQNVQQASEAQAQEAIQ